MCIERWCLVAFRAVNGPKGGPEGSSVAEEHNTDSDVTPIAAGDLPLLVEDSKW